MPPTTFTVPDSWTSEQFERVGVRIHFNRTGDPGKPPILLLHGATDNGLCWYSLANRLAPDFDIVMPDARGHGLTEGGTAAITLPEMVDDCAALIEQLELGPVRVIGHSMGAQMATELAARHPELVDRVVLEDPAYRTSTKGGIGGFVFLGVMRLGMAWFRHRSIEQIRRIADRLFKTWADDDKATWAIAQSQSARNHVMKRLLSAFDRNRDWGAYLRTIRVPVLLLTADKGLIKPVEAAEVMSALQHGTAVNVGHAGHNIRRDNTPDYLAAVLPFLTAAPRQADT